MPDGIHWYLEKTRAGKLVKPSRCARCGSSRFLRWHGTYYRSLITLTRTWLIPIKRLYCPLCNRTFAFLPSFVVKFHRYARATITMAIRALRSHTFDAVADLFMEQGNHYVATLTLYFWRRKFT